MRTTLLLPIILVCCILLAAGLPQTDDLAITEAQLGKKLFFDPILSGDKKVSCASCHKPEYGFADNIPFSFGVDSTPTTRNTPTVKNVLARSRFFWDGRATTLEEQALKPIENPDEMNLPIHIALRRLNENTRYRRAFKKIYGKEADSTNLAHAIAAFERTLESTFTAWDRYALGDSTALSASAIRGRELFLNKANCFECHFGPDFTFDEMINIGIYDGVKYRDKGLGAITGNTEDDGKFKVPGLRNIVKTAPYMHNGMFATLREVIEYYNNPDSFISHPINVDPRLKKPLHLTEQEKRDLEAFLIALSD